MKANILIAILCLLVCCKHSASNEPYNGFVVTNGNIKVSLQDIESLWAGGGNSQELRVSQDGNIVFDTLFNDPFWLIDSVVYSKPVRIVLAHVLFGDKVLGSGEKELLHKNKEMQIEFSVIIINHTIWNEKDSCTKLDIGKDSISFYTKGAVGLLSVPKCRIRLLPPREAELYFIQGGIVTRTLIMDSLNVIKLNSALSSSD